MKFLRTKYGSRLLAVLLLLTGGLRSLSAAELLHSRFSLVLPDLFPTNDVRDLFQDSDGYIWMGTDCGLLRYDGYDLVTYDQSLAPGIGFNAFVNTVAEDRDKTIWIGTEHGLFALDKTTGIISAAECGELADDNVSVVFCDTGNGVWAAGEKGLFRKGPTLRKFFPVDLRDNDGIPVSGITSVIKDHNVCLWIVARSCGLLRYDIREKRAYLYDDPLLREARVVFCDSEGSIWVGTSGAGLLRLRNPYNPSELEYVRYRHTAEEGSLLDDSISDIAEDTARGILWIGTHSGVSVLHDKENIRSFENFKAGSRVGDLPYNNVTSLLLSRDGQLWVAMADGGICKTQMREFQFLDNSSATLRNRYNTSAILSLHYLGEGNFWLGLPDVGLVHYNIHSGRVQSARELPGLSRMPEHTSITSILQRKADRSLWFATADAGIWIHDPVRGTLRQVSRQQNPELSDNRIHMLREDPEGNVWIGTRHGVSLVTRHGEILTLGQWWGGPIPGKLDVSDFCFDKQGRIWIAVYAEGVIRLDPRTREYRHFSTRNGLPDECVVCLCEDALGSVWAGSSHGIVVCPPEGKEFRPATSLPAQGRMRVTNILKDSNDRIWVSTANSVYSFSADAAGNIENINTYQVAGENRAFYFNRHSAALLDYSRVAFGGSDGLRLFTGNRVYQRGTTLPLVLTDFKVHNRSLRQMPQSERSQIADKDIAYASAIRLDHRQNNFSIDFSVLSFLSPTDNIFQYRLEGVDADFVTVDWRHRTAFYSNLPAGNYTFRLRVAGSNGVWCSNEKTLDIRITPPPMESWWAILIYVILFLGLVYAGFRFTRYRLRMEHEIRMSHFEQQQIEELNRVKLQFFTNVTHELMTPLSILLTSLEGLTNGVGEPRTLYSVMTVNATRLMRLIQQILEFRKAESGNLKLGVSQGDLAAFVRKCGEAFTPLVSKKGLSFSFEASPESIPGWFDPDKVDKIVYNLLSNAAKYTPAGGRIGITVKRLGGEVEIEVANSGERMSRETIDNLFKRFYDGKYRKFHTIGTGIGLSLVNHDSQGAHRRDKLRGARQLLPGDAADRTRRLRHPGDRHRDRPDGRILRTPRGPAHVAPCPGRESPGKGGRRGIRCRSCPGSGRPRRRGGRAPRRQECRRERCRRRAEADGDDRRRQRKPARTDRSSAREAVPHRHSRGRPAGYPAADRTTGRPGRFRHHDGGNGRTAALPLDQEHVRILPHPGHPAYGQTRRHEPRRRLQLGSRRLHHQTVQFPGAPGPDRQSAQATGDAQFTLPESGGLRGRETRLHLDGRTVPASGHRLCECPHCRQQLFAHGFRTRNEHLAHGPHRETEIADGPDPRSLRSRRAAAGGLHAAREAAAHPRCRSGLCLRLQRSEIFQHVLQEEVRPLAA